MPRISFFYGISIYMYWAEAHHARPHFHARYAGHAASIDLEGNVIAGSLPPRAHASWPNGQSCVAWNSKPTGTGRAVSRILSPSNRFPSIHSHGKAG